MKRVTHQNLDCANTWRIKCCCRWRTEPIILELAWLFFQTRTSLFASTSLWMWKAKRSTWWTAAWPTTSPIPSFCGRSAALTSSSLLTFLHGRATPAHPSRWLHTHAAEGEPPDYRIHLKTSDLTYPQELLLAEKWARMNKLPFPKIDPKVFDREGLKECYVFKPRKGEKNCPTVIHFVLVNINFRTFKAPGGYPCGASHCMCGDIWVFTHSPVSTVKDLPLNSATP